MAAITYTLRCLAHLLRYPDASMRAHLPEVRQAIDADGALNAGRRAELIALAHRLEAEGLEAEAAYVDLFDRGRATALHLFEHVHGDSRDRGQAMVDLVLTYEQAGLHLAPGELPDHLTVLLEYASTQPAKSARAFLNEFAHIVQAIAEALRRRRSGYVAVLAAVLDLAGQPLRQVAIAEEPALDETWAEPPAFDGCSSAGQAGPGTEQPVHVVRRASGQGAGQR
ncbi:Nitrate reductase molybdenum cofactor assembly chaperone NarJ [Cupriavidus laharis]|uniref:Nitrate reductase molybdenum cofactor assembly chaperone NarJ n=1 Tax=Cupriavidus laharis TaxID=151654 RepID=A0ABM8XPN7_9BURK|nr:nitrate reductase molybdenum cofactor assembly chaperone [Cupriavidus laharis]CAG9182202.1 Nitrate reductase molybdenum cofactor assembly chaperone NarJ [Cupriavidus laharis]